MQEKLPIAGKDKDAEPGEETGLSISRVMFGRLLADI